MGEYATSHREFILTSLHCFLRHKPSLLFISAVGGEPKTISDRLFRSICLGDKVVSSERSRILILHAPRFSRPFGRTNHDREISSLTHMKEVRNLNKKEQKINKHRPWSGQERPIRLHVMVVPLESRPRLRIYGTE
jgi:hypothetical protein